MSSSYKKPNPIEISREVKRQATEYSKGLDNDRHYGRKIGKLDDLYRSCIGQIMTHLYLDEIGIAHDYMKPYHENGRPKEEFDLRIADEEYDVKCRGRWNEQYFYNIKILISEHERDERLKVDNYIFGTTDEVCDNFYILGGLNYYDLWDKLHAIDNPEKYPYPPAGYILSRELDSLNKLIFRV